MPDNKYKETYLTQVIVRLDFASPIEAFSKKLPKPLDSEALKLFPIKEPQERFGAKIRLDKKGSKIEEEIKDILWTFYDKDRVNKLVIAQTHLSIECKKYNSFTEFNGLLTKISDALFKNNDELVIKRFGLRFINNIEIKDDSHLLVWDKFLNKKLLALFDVPEDKNTIARALNLLVLRYDDILLNFQYGMHNPDYPAKMKRKLFILDYDAYVSGLIEPQEVQNNLDKCHEKIYKQFEDSISNGLRKIMKQKNE